MNFKNKLKERWTKGNTLFCVGLDPDIAKFPEHIGKSQMPIFTFNKAIIDATGDLVCAFKPQIAYYSGQGAERELQLTIEYIRDKFPDVPVILDAKRGDIGSTSAMYAREAFDRYQADAVTVNPYMGLDSIAPFLDRADRGVVILCRTSNSGAPDLQNLLVSGEKLYQVVARKAVSDWNYNDNVLLAMGATYPSELAEVRAIVGDMPFLMPGVGAQGGGIAVAVKNGADRHGTGMIISSSREVLYAGNGTDFDQKARQVAQRARDEINSARQPLG